MPQIRPVLIRASYSLAAVAAWIFAGDLRAAPRPLPELSSEEIAMRALVQPLRDGITEGPELEPLRDWLTTRAAAGKTRDAERELRRVLKRMHEEFNKDLLRAAELISTHQRQRVILYNEITDRRVTLRRALERSDELAPIPTAEELWPGRTEFSDGFVAGDTGAIPAITNGGSDELAAALGENDPDAEPRDTDRDEHAILDRLTLDLTALRHLLHECDNEYEEEKHRHQDALDALEKFLAAHRTQRKAA